MVSWGQAHPRRGLGVRVRINRTDLFLTVVRRLVHLGAMRRDGVCDY